MANNPFRRKSEEKPFGVGIKMLIDIDLKFVTTMIPVAILFGTIIHSWFTGKGLWN
jgi:hypothetical protein